MTKFRGADGSEQAVRRGQAGRFVTVVACRSRLPSRCPFKSAIGLSRSIAIVLWECAARKKPLEIANLAEFATRVCLGNERPEGDFNVDVPDGYRALVRACWHENATARPTTKDVLSTLTAMHQTLSKRASTSG